MGPPTFGGLALGLVFWLASLTPTLIPRPWLIQAVISALALAIGYAIGTLVGRLVHRLLERGGRAPGPTVARWGWIALGAAWLIGIPVGMQQWTAWQNEQRQFMGMPPVAISDAAFAALVSLAVAGILLLLAREIGKLVGALNRLIERRIPSAPAPPVTALVVVVVLALVGTIVVRAGTAFATDMFTAVDQESHPGVEQPELAEMSGSDASLVAWDALGRWGRYFAANSVTIEELGAFHGADAEVTQPVRAYVGVQSADSLEEGADLAVAELERAGGFDREVLAVWVPTGSGWMIPEATDALELLHRGDTAIVGLQYSSLPSLLSVFLDAGLSTEAGLVLFDAVHERWSQLPADERPTLVMYGKSLGTAGVEAPFADADAATSVANMAAELDGALVVGAMYGNTILTQVTDGREPDSPVWQPLFDGGRTVRFVTRDPAQPGLDPGWQAPRVVYLQHPSDPVSFWGLDSVWLPPEWMDQPRGFDTPEAAFWFPIVTGLQAAGDLFLQLDVPAGFGHVYSTDYVDGWARVVPPDGWTDADTDRLERHLDDGVSEDVEP